MDSNLTSAGLMRDDDPRLLTGLDTTAWRHIGRPIRLSCIVEQCDCVRSGTRAEPGLIADPCVSSGREKDGCPCLWQIVGRAASTPRCAAAWNVTIFCRTRSSPNRSRRAVFRSVAR